MEFASRSQLSQVARLRRTALRALEAYPLSVVRLRLLNHGFNTTFRVDTASGERYALRLNVNSRRDPAQLAGEMAWLAALSRDTDLRVPTPQPTRDGALLHHVPSDDLGRDLPAALFSWLPGRDLGAAARPEQLGAVGRAAATLHAHALTWTPPANSRFHDLSHPLMEWPDNLDTPLLDDEGRAVVREVVARAGAVLRRRSMTDTPRPLHADLHPWNLKWSRGQLWVFDFDDCGHGIPLLDLAISAYYLRPKDELEAALLEGYAGAAPLPELGSDYETLVAGRAALLLNDVIANTTAEIRDMLPRYLPNAVIKMRHFLDTGTFRHDLPGLIPAR